MIAEIIAICAGASCGALLRWLFGMALNSFFPVIPPGTLAANLLGAYIIGIMSGVFYSFPDLSPYLRLFIVTGFLGALTTFSTFTAEMGTLLAANKILTAFCGICLHVGGSLILFFLGMGTFHFARHLFAKMP